METKGYNKNASKFNGVIFLLPALFFQTILSSIISGILILVAIILTIIHSHILSEYETIMILFAMAISLGIHGIQHAYEEIYYDYNPFVNGKLLPKDM